MYSHTLSEDGKSVFYKRKVLLGKRELVIDSGKFGVCKKELSKACKYSLRMSVKQYVEKASVNIVAEHVRKVKQWFRDEKVSMGPGLRFLVVRICSMLGIKPKENLRDVYPSPRCEAHEFMFYGILVPHFGWYVNDCIYYRRWVKVVRELSKDCGEGSEIRPRFIFWEDWYERYWLGFKETDKKGFIKCGKP
ncbi:Hypothetical predicted protein [Paramuricea clavata]|uniref:Uncharacterized protein n=1 Tax=Paramuricea clavata TaxID=317549 RepID=A0A7D9JV46_PARCT|nr:Hypothetical predicted protein [Paramuricea clavata]